MGLVLKYVQEPNKDRNHYRYRRRVTKQLRPYVGTGELIAVLGNSYDAALKAYPSVHAGFERELELARRAEKLATGKRPAETLTDRERYDLLIERLKELGIDDPFAGPEDEADAEQRELLADSIAARYAEDPDTGRPVITDERDAFIIRTLMHKAPAKPAHAFDDAVKLYLKERVSGSPLEVKKTTQRVNRAVARVKAALGRYPALAEFSREDARKVRDYMLNLPSLSPASVKRELNILKAIVNHAITEFELTASNPLAKLDIPGLDEENEFEKRNPFPAELLNKTRANVMAKSNGELCLIWRLLEGTGARLAEITGLRVEDVTLDGLTPNIRVIWHEERRVKTRASRRYIPLVGDAFTAAQEAMAKAGDRPMLFAAYGNENGPTNASQSLMKRVKEIVGENDRLKVHSLRHNMKDRLILAGIDELTQKLILGHGLKGTGERVYGGSPARLQATMAAMKKAFGQPVD
jgi:integrase